MSLNRTEFEIPKMDCPSEERIIRMALDKVSTKHLKFDIATRGEGSIMVSFSDLGVAGMYMYSLVVDGQLISTKRMLLVQ